MDKGHYVDTLFKHYIILALERAGVETKGDVQAEIETIIPALLSEVDKRITEGILKAFQEAGLL